MLLAEPWAYGPAPPSPRLSSRWRRLTFTIAAVLLIVAVSGVLLGASSLVFGWTEQGGAEIHRVHLIGWGTITILLITFASGVQLRESGRTLAPMQQLVVCLLAGGVSMLATGALLAPAHLITGAMVAGPTATMVLTHPRRSELLRAGRMSFPMLFLSLAAAAPLVWFAHGQIQMQRIDATSPHGKLFHWGTMSTLAIAIALVAFLASLRTEGWRVPAWTTGASTVVFGLASMLYPTYASSVGRGWGAVAIGFGVTFVLVAELEMRWTTRG